MRKKLISRLDQLEARIVSLERQTSEADIELLRTNIQQLNKACMTVDANDEMLIYQRIANPEYNLLYWANDKIETLSQIRDWQDTYPIILKMENNKNYMLHAISAGALLIFGIETDTDAVFYRNHEHYSELSLPLVLAGKHLLLRPISICSKDVTIRDRQPSYRDDTICIISNKAGTTYLKGVYFAEDYCIPKLREVPY